MSFIPSIFSRVEKEEVCKLEDKESPDKEDLPAGKIRSWLDDVNSPIGEEKVTLQSLED